MSIPELCIKRPVFTIVISIILIIFGLMHYAKLPIRKLPNIDEPKITITTEFEGASPELVEKELTVPIENIIAGTSGVNQIRSSSQLGYSRITIKFQLNVDIQEALSDIRNKVVSISKRLPDGAKTPTVTKNDSDDNPALILGFRSSGKNALEITDYLKRSIKPTIEEINGVGEVFFFGNRDYAIKIWLNPAKMMSRSITVSDIKTALLQQNIDIPSGQIKSENRNYTVITHARLDDTAQFQKLIISDKKGVITRLSDIAHIAITSNNDDNYLRINGHPAVGFGIIPQSTANPVQVANKVKKIIKKISPSLPQDMQVEVVFDSAKFIKQSVNEVYKTLAEAIIFVVLVVFLFLGNLRAALIPIVTVPICLIASFWPMHLLGIGINTITLLALVLAIGLVVDDAIVMLENIYRHMQQGKSTFQAACDGSKEIVFAIIAMTLTLAAVYAPMGFVQGFTGKLFLHFGLTLSIAVIISGIIALTLSPMMCSKMLEKHSNGYSRFLDKLFSHLMDKYKSLLTWCLANKHKIMTLLFILLAAGVLLYRQIPATLAPTEDQSYIFGILNSPTNSSVNYTDYYSRKLEKMYEKIPEKTAYLTSTRPNGAFSVLNLKPWDKRKKSQQVISDELGKSMQDLVGVNAFPVSPSAIGRGSSDNSGFSFQVLTNGTYQSLNEVMDELVDSLTKYPGLTNVKNNLALDSEQINIDINRILASDLQVKLSDIAETISTMLGGSNPINFNYNGQSYDVVVQLQKQDRASPAVLDTLYVKSQRGKIIPLSSLVTVSNSIGPESLPHINRLRTASITAEVAPGYDQ
jgi:multidrug efflux pump